MSDSALPSRIGMIAVGVLLAANVIVPVLWGDVYPFTSAPMFRDSPQQFCNYRVFAADGQELSPDDWQVQRVYDGNPVGYGVGVRPPAVIEQEFGVVHDETTVRRHFEQQLAEARNQRHEYVDVVQEIVGPVDSQLVGIAQTLRWRISR